MIYDPVQKKNLHTPSPQVNVRHVPDTLAAPTATTMFVLFDTLLVVPEDLATTTRLGQHRRRSHRAQGVLRDALNASDLRPLYTHATISRICTTAQSPNDLPALTHRATHGARVIQASPNAAAPSHSLTCAPERLVSALDQQPDEDALTTTLR